MPRIDEAVWLGWRQRAEQDKREARKTDADLAAEISEQVGYDVGRALVNHWFRGRRVPSLLEFMALCAALGSDPGEILLNVRLVAHRLPEEVATAMHQPAPSPDYLHKSAKSLRQSRAVRKSKRTVKPKVRV